MGFKDINIEEYIPLQKIKRAGILLAFLVPMLFIPVIKNVAIVFLLVGLNLMFSFYTQYLRRFNVGVELTTFLTVILALKFGSFWGAIISLMMIMAEYVGTMRLSILAIATIPSVMLMGAIAPMMSGMDIAVIGLVLSIAYNLVTFSLCFLIRQRWIGLLMFAVTNVLFNRILFSVIGPLLV